MSEQAQVVSGVREGELLAGKYRIEKVLGVGGMGVVVAARHVELDERVAVKFLLPETLANRDAVSRFAGEARRAVKIKSEHVAKVVDVGKLENGAPYMVMEYLEGSDLSSWLQRMGALPVEQAVEFILQASEAIAEAHSLQIVHRDLKPANLFVIRRPDGALSVKVLDFGISKSTNITGSSAGAAVTKTSALMGSPLYMSPEQMQSSKDVDARGDIWALGVMLFELLTAALPFAADTMPELVLRIVQSPPEPLRAHRPDAPEELEAVILKCLEKDRGRRFQTVAELALALLPFAPKRARISVERISGIMRAAGYSASSLALPPSSDQISEQPVGSGTNGSWGTTMTRKRTGGIAIAAAGFVALLGAGTAGWYHYRTPDLEKRVATDPVPALSEQKTQQVEPSPETTQSSAGAPSPSGNATSKPPDEAPAPGGSPPGNTSNTGKPPAPQPPVVCSTGALQCAGNSVRTCVAGSHWKTVPCTPGSRCRDGVCEIVKHPLPPPSEPSAPAVTKPTAQPTSPSTAQPAASPTNNMLQHRK